MSNGEEEGRYTKEETHHKSEENSHSLEVQERTGPWVRPMNSRECFLFEGNSVSKNFDIPSSSYNFFLRRR